MMKRREFVSATLLSTAGLVTGCFDISRAATGNSGSGRLTARPRTPSSLASAGLQPLGLEGTRDGRLFVPQNHVATERLPLLVLLHGAGQSSALWFGSYATRGETNRIVMLAPDSRDRTWDIAFGGFGADVTFIDRALNRVFDRCSIDPDRIFVAGFSDGASYALSLGMTNGDFFRKIVAYSPGFFRNPDPRGNPPIFVSHGTNDTILPIDQTSRAIVPMLKEAGYTVSLTEFTGGHEVPPAISDAAITWLLAT